MGLFLKMIGPGKSSCPEPDTEPLADLSPARPPRRVHIGDNLILSRRRRTRSACRALSRLNL